MTNRLKFHSPWLIALCLLFLVTLSYGIVIPWLGFYWDDWAKTLVHRVWGLSGYWSYYAEDRPLSGWTHIALISLFGDAPLGWHLFGLAMRWITAFCAWWTFTLLWPKAKFQAFLAAVLFSIYPVFTQQPIAVTFHQQWLQYALLTISLGLMAASVRSPARFWLYTSLSCLLILAQLSVTEYFVGLELLRPFMLLILVTETQTNLKQRLLVAARLWLPYLVISTAFILWRLFFIKLTGADPYRAETLYNLVQAPWQTLVQMAKIIPVETWYVLFSSWAPVLDPGNMPVMDILPWVKWTWVASAVAGIVSVLFFLFYQPRHILEDAPGKNWAAQAAFIGILAVFLGCAPGWITGRWVIQDFHSNRYAMPAMLGASLVWAALADWLCRSKVQKALLASALVALAVGFNLRNSDQYIRIWQDQMQFYWQLSWRLPNLKPGTALIFGEEPFPNQGLFSSSAALNLLYPQPPAADHLAYWIYTLRPRFNAPPTEPVQLNFKTQFRTLTFQGSTPKTLLVQYLPQRSECLWVLSEYEKDNPELPAITASVLYLSNLDQVDLQPPVSWRPPPDLFGKEPPREFCYFYQKAELARQTGNWAEVVNLGNRALKAGYIPGDRDSRSPHDWLPLIEGYIRSAAWEVALQLSEAAYHTEPAYSRMICSVWSRASIIPAESPAKSSALNRIQTNLNCH